MNDKHTWIELLDQKTRLNFLMVEKCVNKTKLVQIMNPLLVQNFSQADISLTIKSFSEDAIKIKK